MPLGFEFGTSLTSLAAWGSTFAPKTLEHLGL
jgi:hypothetical protein